MMSQKKIVDTIEFENDAVSILNDKLKDKDCCILYDSQVLVAKAVKENQRPKLLVEYSPESDLSDLAFLYECRKLVIALQNGKENDKVIVCLYCAPLDFMHDCWHKSFKIRITQSC